VDGFAQPPAARARGGHGAVLPLLAGWSVAAACFGFVYWRLSRVAERRGESVPGYLAEVLGEVRWAPWLTLMVAYSVVYLLLDAAVVTRVVCWSLAPTRYREVLPLRAAAYLLSLLNEQVGKGAIAVALHRRHRVPVGAAASSMLFLMVAEFLSLCLWATLGFAIGADRLPAAFNAVPWVAAAALLVVVLGHRALAGTARGRDLAGRRPVLQAFGRAGPVRYLEVLAWRAPAMALAVAVYTWSLGWFGVPVGVGEMLGILPVVLLGTAVPGPMRAVSVVLWVLLFPDHPAELAAFGLVQHLAFVLTNALIGTAFLRAATRALTGGPASGPAAASTAGS
jgi:hypothetical protein